MFSSLLFTMMCCVLLVNICSLKGNAFFTCVVTGVTCIVLLVGSIVGDDFLQDQDVLSIVPYA